MRLLSGGDTTTTSGKVSPFWGSLKMPVVDLRHVVTPLGLYALALSTGAFGLLLALVTHGDRYEGNVWVLVGLGALAALAERQGVQVGLHTHTSVSVLPILFAAVVLGPVAGMIVGFAALLPYFGRPALRWIVWTSSRMLLAGLAGLVASLFLHGHPGLPRVLLAVAAAAAVEGVGDALLTSVTVGLRHEGAFGADPANPHASSLGYCASLHADCRGARVCVHGAFALDPCVLHAAGNCGAQAPASLPGTARPHG